MTAPLRPLQIRAPAAFGLNTEEADASADPRWALELTNAVFDTAGRVAAREGWTYSTAEGNRHSSDVEAIFEFHRSATSKWIVHAADNKLYTSDDAGTPAAADLTDLNNRTGTNTPTANHWKFLNYNGSIVAVQAGHIPQYLTDPTTAATNFADITTTNGAGASDADWGNAGLSAFGRLWITDDTETVLHWSDLLMNVASGDWGGAGSGGNVNTANHWPDGLDKIVAVHEWQSRLVVFGTRSILIYTGTADPANDLAIEDIITASGCVARDSVASVGTDLVYLARDGLRSLARGIQFSTMPLQQLSRPVRQDLVREIQDVADVNDIKCAYSRRHGFYLARIGNRYWMFDTRAPLERGELRASKWFGIGFKSLTAAEDGTLYLGQSGGVATYGDYLDNTSTYQWRWRSPWLEAQSGQTVIPKYALMTIDTPGDYQITMRWAVDYVEIYSTDQRSLGAARTLAEWNVAEWGTDEWSGAFSTVQRIKFALSRFGDRVQVGASLNVNGARFSLIGINVFAKAGRLAA